MEKKGKEREEISEKNWSPGGGGTDGSGAGTVFLNKRAWTDGSGSGVPQEQEGVRKETKMRVSLYEWSLVPIQMKKSYLLCWCA
jgi:hypothetical protein